MYLKRACPAVNMPTFRAVEGWKLVRAGRLENSAPMGGVCLCNHRRRGDCHTPTSLSSTTLPSTEALPASLHVLGCLNLCLDSALFRGRQVSREANVTNLQVTATGHGRDIFSPRSSSAALSLGQVTARQTWKTNRVSQFSLQIC